MDSRDIIISGLESVARSATGDARRVIYARNFAGKPSNKKLELHTVFGDNPLKFYVVCLLNGTDCGSTEPRKGVYRD